MKREVYILLNNVRSVHNVGSIFRTSDALGVAKIFLAGHTPTPLDRFGNKRKDLAKVALGAEDSVPWEYHSNAQDLIRSLKQQGIRLIAVEQTSASVDYKTVTVTGPTVFLFGNEVGGVEPELLEMADVVAEIPMSGTKESLNVSVSFGVAMFRMLGQ